MPRVLRLDSVVVINLITTYLCACDALSSTFVLCNERSLVLYCLEVDRRSVQREHLPRISLLEFPVHDEQAGKASQGSTQHMKCFPATPEPLGPDIP